LGSVAAIFTSPVKSLSLSRSDSVTVGPGGIAEDRRFFLVDAEGRLVTQRQQGRLTLVQAGYSSESDVLVLQFPDGQHFNGQMELGGAVTTVMWGRQVAGQEVLGPWSEAISEFCGSPVRLIKTDNPCECFDEYPVSILSQASIDDLGGRVNGGPEFDGRRFRPNFLLEGCTPHEEDSWLGGVVQIGPDLRIRLVAPDPRCAITTLDPDTGERDFDVPKLILSYRPSSRAAYFGVYGAVEATGTVSVGDNVELVQAPAV
jgi:uncharacterized protein YcbX